MKVLKNFLQFSFLAILSIMVVSCSSDQTETADANTADVESTRGAMATKVAAKAYYYKSLASFANGQANIKLTDMATLEGKKVNLVVLYEADAPWAEVFSTGRYDMTGNDQLNGLMESYEMSIVKQFAIDEDNEGIVLEPNGVLENAVEAAREFSMVDNVMMVHVKEVPAEEEVDATASNN